MNYDIEVISNVVLEERKLSDIHTVERLAKLLNDCFYDGNNEITNITYIYKGHDFFICSHNSKIVGLASVNINSYATLSETNIDTYNTDRYIINNDNRVYDKQNNTIVDEKRQNVDPLITSLCKDKEYKNVGSVILKYIEKYYRKKGTTKIYLVAGSNRNYNVLKNAHMFNNTDGINKYNKLYKQDNENLIKYYNKNGYKILDGYYDYNYIKLKDGSYIITFLNTLYKNI